MATNNNKSYYLCSSEVIKRFPHFEHSKPFKSGFCNEENESYYIALLNFDEIEKYYNEVIEPINEDINSEEFIDFWCRELVPGQMDVDKFTLKSIKKNGLLYEISDKLHLTATRNQAMTIYNLAKKFNCNPIEFIEKITK